MTGILMIKIGILKNLLVWVENNMAMAQTLCMIASAFCTILMLVVTIISLRLSFVLEKNRKNIIARLCVPPATSSVVKQMTA